MFPDRVFLGIGRGEALNEVTSGHRWPSNIEKFRRLKEAIHLIKKLWIEDWVDFRGNPPCLCRRLQEIIRAARAQR